MLYREAGQFKTSYEADQAIFPIAQDRWFVILLVVAAYTVVPFVANNYWYEVILLPVLVFSLSALSLNVLTGYCGQVSLGQGGFMAVGAYSSFKLATAFPELNVIFVFLLSGLPAAAAGVVFGIPSLRIKGFYLAVATLAAQFFFEWLFQQKGWFSNYSPSGTIAAPHQEAFGLIISGPQTPGWVKYVIGLTFLVVFCIIVKNLTRSHLGRSWMAIRDMDIAAELIGIKPLQTKLLAFAVSTYIAGVSGALFLFLVQGSLEMESFDIINMSFPVLFMIIVGGLGSVMGSIFGAAFLILTPVFIKNFPELTTAAVVVSLGIGCLIWLARYGALRVLPLVAAVPLAGWIMFQKFQSNTAEHIVLMFFGLSIILILIFEPHGLARLWQIAKEKLRLWPFPY
ncbi:MAG: branched-chain amino acid ABC transporter permease [Hyphomicrobiales bacterium]|nr:branched-chain amino acid ABC transporter permease [Hyphomicrobiales bacterium]